MHRINGIYAQQFNHRYEHAGHLFEGRYSSRVIESDDHLGEACQYVWNNPVRAGLCERSGDWPWSGGPTDL